jgi:hypothetical protein
MKSGDFYDMKEGDIRMLTLDHPDYCYRKRIRIFNGEILEENSYDFGKSWGMLVSWGNLPKTENKMKVTKKSKFESVCVDFSKGGSVDRFISIAKQSDGLFRIDCDGCFGPLFITCIDGIRAIGLCLSELIKELDGAKQ